MRCNVKMQVYHARRIFGIFLFHKMHSYQLSISMMQDAFLSITAHYIDKEKWKLKHYTLCD